MARGGPVKRTRRGDFELRLTPDERTILRGLPDQLRNLIENEDPTSDPAMARLYPPAYEDDPIRNLEFERMAGDDLTSQRLSSISAMEGSIDADRLSEEQLLVVVGRAERPAAGARNTIGDHRGDDRGGLRRR